MTSPQVTEAEHLRHMTDGTWHDECRFCIYRRRHGGNGIPPKGKSVYD